MAQVRKEIEGVQRLDFDRGEGIPESWEQLRKEARKLVKNLPVYEAVLKKWNKQPAKQRIQLLGQ